MNVTINDLMQGEVITIASGATVQELRELLQSKDISAVPVVDGTELVGIVSQTDLVDAPAGDTPVRDVASEKVYTVPAYDGPHVAARVMRNHRIHRVVVTHEQKIVGILSSFDLLKLVEDHRFVMKNAPTPSGKKRKRQ